MDNRNQLFPWFLPGQQGVGKLDILCDRFILVPLRLDRIGCGQDRGPGIQGTDDTSLGNGQGLLFLQ